LQSLTDHALAATFSSVWKTSANKQVPLAACLALLLGLAGCASADAPSTSSAGNGGAPGGTGGSGGTAGSSLGGSDATGGKAPLAGTGGSSGGSGGSAGSVTGGKGGTGGSPTGGVGGGTGGDAPGGMSGGGTGGSPTGGSGGDPAGGTGGSAVGGAGGDTAGGGGQTGGSGGSGGAVPPGCTAPTEYPNLFVTVSEHTQEESDAKVTAAWNQLFGSGNNTVYYNGPGSEESYILDTGNNDVRTEGMSYGMMTAVQLDKQAEFDRLWAWVKAHMAQGTTGEIAWHCSPSGSKLSNGGAPDGEEYMATALIFANKRWGSTGRFDYAVEAQWVLDLTRTKYFNQMYHIVKFVSGSDHTDASYILPAFYQVWACFDTENADFWNEAVTAGREYFHIAANSNGVMPDQSSFTGQTVVPPGSDTKRCVMNIMMDTNFFGADPWQTDTYATTYGNYMRTNSDNTAAQYSCNALLGFGLPASTGKPFVDRLWSAQIPTGQYRYYDGTLYMLALLHVSGTFKLYY